MVLVTERVAMIMSVSVEEEPIIKLPRKHYKIGDEAGMKSS